MSLVRLLTAGKSLVGLKESENRYRLSSQRLLPRFEPKKNPFGSGMQTQMEESEKAAEPATAEPRTTATAMTPASKTETVPVSTPHSVPFTGSLLSRLWQQRSWFRGLFSRRGQRPVSTRREAKRMLQVELSLQAVKVVRNDLSDSDVEIVTARQSATVNRPAAAESGAAAAPAIGRWSKAAERLFGAGKR
jgi:hypothetical protein